MLSLVVLQRGMLLCARLAIRERHRTEVRKLALRILAAAKGTSHACLNSIDLLEPARIKRLSGRNDGRLLLRVRTGGRRVLGSIAGLATALGS